MSRLKETLDQNQNSIELALVNFLLVGQNVSEKPEPKFLKKLGSQITTAVPFGDYLELGYALDEFDHEDPTGEKSKKAAARIKGVLKRHQSSIQEEVTDALEQDSAMSTRKDFVNKVVGSALREAKGAKSSDRENLEIARQAKPRWDPKQTPKAGTFDKDTKKMIKRKDPMDRKTIKHKGKVYESVEEFLKEGVLGMTQVPALTRLRGLAGLEDEPVAQDKTPSPVEGQTEAYAQAMDYLALIQELMPHMTVQEFKDLMSSIRVMADELEMD